MPAKEQAKSEAKVSASEIEGYEARMRLLLALWDMAEVKTNVKIGKLTERIKRKTEHSDYYQKIFEELQESGAITFTTKNRVVSVSLTDKGLEMLKTGLNNPGFRYGAGVGAKTANALLKWIRKMGTVGNGALPAAAEGKSSNSALGTSKQ